MTEEDFASIFKKDHCVICNLGFKNKEPVCVTKKRILTIVECCEKHGRGDLHANVEVLTQLKLLQYILNSAEILQTEIDLGSKVQPLMMTFRVSDCS